MEKNQKEITPHPDLLDLLFAHRSSAYNVFSDVLGLHELNHVAIGRINSNGEIIIFSSTPALEFNLFTSNLWRFDNTYARDWLCLNTHAPWEFLYESTRFDELYYMKQLKHRYALGLSLVSEWKNAQFIYSMGSKKSDAETRNLFQEPADFYKIGQYCANALMPLFEESENNHAKKL
jgi:hypothetical protein